MQAYPSRGASAPVRRAGSRCCADATGGPAAIPSATPAVTAWMPGRLRTPEAATPARASGSAPERPRRPRRPPAVCPARRESLRGRRTAGPPTAVADAVRKGASHTDPGRPASDSPFPVLTGWPRRACKARRTPALFPARLRHRSPPADRATGRAVHRRGPTGGRLGSARQAHRARAVSAVTGGAVPHGDDLVQGAQERIRRGGRAGPEEPWAGGLSTGHAQCLLQIPQIPVRTGLFHPPEDVPRRPTTSPACCAGCRRSGWTRSARMSCPGGWRRSAPARPTSASGVPGWPSGRRSSSGCRARARRGLRPVGVDGERLRAASRRPADVGPGPRAVPCREDQPQREAAALRGDAVLRQPAGRGARPCAGRGFGWAGRGEGGFVVGWTDARFPTGHGPLADVLRMAARSAARLCERQGIKGCGWRKRAAPGRKPSPSSAISLTSAAEPCPEEGRAGAGPPRPSPPERARATPAWPTARADAPGLSDAGQPGMPEALARGSGSSLASREAGGPGGAVRHDRLLKNPYPRTNLRRDCCLTQEK